MTEVVPKNRDHFNCRTRLQTFGHRPKHPDVCRIRRWRENNGSRDHGYPFWRLIETHQPMWKKAKMELDELVEILTME